MRRLFLHVGAILLVSMALGRAQAHGPDERYVEIYYAIQEADQLVEKGQLASAAAKYVEAQTALKNLQAAHPAWNENVVKFRLDYIAEQLAPLARKVATQAPAPATAPAAAAAPSPPQAQPPGNEAARNLQDEISRLTEQNASLQAKLKEALSVQPAAVDPKEMAKAEQRIKDLEKERDLLRTTLDQQGSKPIQAEAAPADQEKKILEEVRQKLAKQTELAASLQKQNEILQQQLTAVRAATSPGSAADLARELAITKGTLDILRETNIALRANAILLEQRVEELSKNVVPKSVFEELVKERDSLQQKVQGSTPQLTKAPAPATPSQADLDRQLQEALAKLAAYEAKAVPYTPEELSMFKQPDLRVTITEPVRQPGKVTELPAGAAPLMAEGERALGLKKYDEAEKKFQEVLRQDENNLYVLTHLAAAQMDQNHLEDAEKTVKKALAVDPQDSASLFVLGQLRFFQGKYDEAFDALSLSAKQAPEDPRTQYFLGKVLVQKGSRAAAEAALRKAVQLNPGWGEAHYSLAMVYAMQKPPFRELAQWHYQKALAGGYPRNADFEKLLEEKKAEK